MRLFVAVDLPEAMRVRLADLLARLGSEVPDVRWLRSAGIHLTLKVLGEVGEARVAAIAEDLARAASRVPGGFTIAVEGVGTFGGSRNPRVVWLGVKEDGGSLARLQSEVESACERQEFAREQRPFSPHLTLARLKFPSKTLARAVGSLGSVSIGSFPVASFCLFQSLLRPEGAEYVRLREFHLGSGEGGGS